MRVPLLVGKIIVDGGIAVVGDKLHVGGKALLLCGMVIVGAGGLLVIVGAVEGHFVMLSVVAVGVVYCQSPWLLGLYDPSLNPVRQHEVPLGSLDLGSTPVVPHGACFSGTHCGFSTVLGSRFGN